MSYEEADDNVILVDNPLLTPLVKEESGSALMWKQCAQGSKAMEMAVSGARPTKMVWTGTGTAGSRQC